MTVQGFNSFTSREDVRRFMIGMFLLVLIAALFAFPDIAQAAWDGKFGPSDDLKKNTDDSLKGWFQAVAGWGLWLSIGALAISIIFFGGKLWWIPVCFCLLALFGEPLVTQVGSWAGFSATTGKS